MIDTVRMAVQYHERPLWYEHVGKDTKFGKGGVFTATIHPRYTPKLYKLEGTYVPRLQYIERPATQLHIKTFELNIELSLTKLYFGNNFSELTDHLFSAVVNVLSKELQTIYKISISPAEIEQAVIGRIDYSKNTIFTDRTPVSTIINTIKMADISKVYDLQDTNHKNGGQTYHIHTNTIDVVMYDKVADLRQAKVSEKRTHEKDNYTQLHLINEFDKHPNVSIPRWEIRLNSRRTIRKELNSIGVDVDLKFSHLFSTDISRKILLRHWQKVINSLPATSSNAVTATQILKTYKQTEPDMKFAKASALTLMQLLRKEAQEERSVRNIIEHLFGTAQYYRLKKMTRNLSERTESKDLLHISKTITAMKPVIIDDFIK
jgi:hypothetical protein